MIAYEDLTAALDSFNRRRRGEPEPEPTHEDFEVAMDEGHAEAYPAEAYQEAGYAQEGYPEEGVPQEGEVQPTVELGDDEFEVEAESPEGEDVPIEYAEEPPRDPEPPA